jgi:hypothetical protein
MPALGNALKAYFQNLTQALPTNIANSSDVAQTLQGYYGVSWDAINTIGRWWFLIFTGFCLVLGLWRKQFLVGLMSLWLVSLIFIGNTYYLGIPLLNFTNFGAILIMLYLPLSIISAIVIAEIWQRRTEQLPHWLQRVMVIGSMLLLLPPTYARATEVESFRYFVRPADVAAMEWIKENTPPDAVFAVNTFFWLPLSPHGTDAGYWIPYFTGRRTTASSMLFSLGSLNYIQQTLQMSHDVRGLIEGDPTALTNLKNNAVTYIYIGASGNPFASSLNFTALQALPKVQLVYNMNGVWIIKIK